jgi:predicted ribosome quality control (RQC) complex YloA/Tae2 family protein
VDAAVLDCVVAEVRSALLGSTLARGRVVGAHAIAFEAARGRWRLWIDASPEAAGLYCLTPRAARALAEPREPSGRAHHALLLLRKHIESQRVSGIARVPGERTVVLHAGGIAIALRISGAPAATLVVDGAPVGSWGPGGDAWPLPESNLERERGWSVSAPPACVLDLPAALDEAADRDLADAPPQIGRRGSGPLVAQPSSWLEASSWYLEARIRGSRFQRARSNALAEARRERRRLERLAQHLEQDLSSFPDPAELRRSGEAILAAPLASAPPGAGEVDLPDPYLPGDIRRVAVDPGLGLHANADKYFARARRIERALSRVEARLSDTWRAREAVGKREEAYVVARDRSDLAPPPIRPGRPSSPSAGPRHYLTSRGLSILVGRGARENHRLTFDVARPEDLWFHAREVPGGHVILRDQEGRSGAEDLREAAEVAAYFSAARGESMVDVHVTARKHVRPARGGHGRVRVAHSETLRVAPRDPEGRLRRR